MVTDFRKDSTVILLVVISAKNVEIVKLYKHLGMVIDDKLIF